MPRESATCIFFARVATNVSQHLTRTLPYVVVPSEAKNKKNRLNIFTKLHAL